MFTKYFNLFKKQKINLTAAMSTRFTIPSRYAGSEYSVWIEFMTLAAEAKPINLGQGFPDYSPPEYVRKMLSEVASDNNPLINQYTRGFGHPRLVNALGALYSKLINRKLNPFEEILITCGAYEALFSSINGHVEVGDEVIIVEPYFDCYEPMVVCAGGVPRFIPLRNTKDKSDTSSEVSSSDWKLDEDELRSAFNDKTKIFILNTPHNPLGKVFNEQELKLIAELCIKHDVLCISDEVYEWIVYKPAKHIRIATLPGMWERTLTIGSAGKSFSVTGWKCGWVYGPEKLMHNVKIVHQNNVYTYVTPIQEAIAKCVEFELSRFDSPDCYYHSISEELRPKRDYFINLLNKVGMPPTIPEAGYFVIASWKELGKKLDLSSEKDKYKDYRFAKWMSKNVKIQGIPPSVFYSGPNKYIGEDYIRYCFFKENETLQKASDILCKWKPSKL